MNIPDLTESEEFASKNQLKIIVFVLSFVGIIMSPIISIVCLIGVFLLFYILSEFEKEEIKNKKNKNYYSSQKNKKNKRK